MVHPVKQLRLQGFIETGGMFEILVFLFVIALDIALIIRFL